MLACARLDPRAYENHIRPQVDLVPEDSDIFKLEDGFGKLKTKLDEVTGSSFEDLEVGHLLKRPREDITLYKQDVALVETFYNADYQTFGYERSDVSDLPTDRLAVFRQVFARLIAPLIMAKQYREWLR